MARHNLKANWAVAAFALLPMAAAWAGPIAPKPTAAESGDGSVALIRLLESGRCAGCQLRDVDLVLANLRDADLRDAHLERANLSQAQLDGAKLNGANLQFTSLLGASLRGADLRGAQLDGTDLRQADLSGALLDRGALTKAHWDQAKGINRSQLGYAQLHNAGVKANEAGQSPEAEALFTEALRLQPDAAVSWIARGISRTQLGKDKLAANDFNYAASLYEQRGETEIAKQLHEAAAVLTKPSQKEPKGNGVGSQLLSAAAAVIKLLGPLSALAPLAL